MNAIGPLSPAAHPPQVGNFEVLGPLGRGGMAEVFLARRCGTAGSDRLAVLKRILPQYEATAKYRNMFIDEARLVAQLHHPNICRAYEFCFQDGKYWLAMEFIHGRNLAEIHARAVDVGRPASIEVVLHVIGALCEALHHAHQLRDSAGAPLGIVHRDVNPTNVMIGFDGAVKLLDFGVAKAEGRWADTTAVGALKGKVAYMSPEQCRGREVDCRTDVFALGILLYELTTGSRLFDGRSEVATLNLIVNEPIPAPSSRVPDYPPELEEVVLRALAYSPDERYSSAGELWSALADFAAHRGAAPSPAATSSLMAELFDPGAWPSGADELATTEAYVGVVSSGELVVELVEEAGADETRVVVHRAGRSSRRWVWAFGLVGVAAVALGIAAAELLNAGPAASAVVDQSSAQVDQATAPEPAAAAQPASPDQPATDQALATPPRVEAPLAGEAAAPDEAGASDGAAAPEPSGETSARKPAVERKRRAPQRAGTRASEPRSDSSRSGQAEPKKPKMRKMIERSWGAP